MICVGWSTETVACRSKNVAMRYRWFRGARNPDLAPEPEISFAVYRMHHVEPDQMAARLEHRDALGEHATPVDHARPVMEGILGAVRRVRKNGIESSRMKRKRNGVRLHVRHYTEARIDAAINANVSP